MFISYLESAASEYNRHQLQPLEWMESQQVGSGGFTWSLTVHSVNLTSIIHRQYKKSRLARCSAAVGIREEEEYKGSSISRFLIFFLSFPASKAGFLRKGRSWVLKSEYDVYIH